MRVRTSLCLNSKPAVVIDSVSIGQPAGSGRYHGDPIEGLVPSGRVLCVLFGDQGASSGRPDARVRIVTRDDHDAIRARAQRAGVEPEDIELQSATSEEMPDLLAEMDIGVMFYAPYVGRVPTRLGEFLAAGVPFVENKGIGDLWQLIATYDVGIVVGDVHDAASLECAAKQLLERYGRILTSGACRDAEEDYFFVEQGMESYRRIYRQLFSASDGAGRRGRQG